MKIIIVGGGKLGKDIADNMLERKYDVRLIEKNRAKCIELANDLDVEIICGDGTELEVLEEAGTKNADCFISVTGSDQDNLPITREMWKLCVPWEQILLLAALRLSPD